MKTNTEAVPAHQTYQIVAFALSGVPALLAWAASYDEAEAKMKDLRENHVMGGSYRTHAGRKIAQGKLEIRRTLKANCTRYSPREQELSLGEFTVGD